MQQFQFVSCIRQPPQHLSYTLTPQSTRATSLSPPISFDPPIGQVESSMMIQPKLSMHAMDLLMHVKDVRGKWPSCATASNRLGPPFNRRLCNVQTHAEHAILHRLECCHGLLEQMLRRTQALIDAAEPPGIDMVASCMNLALGSIITTPYGLPVISVPGVSFSPWHALDATAAQSPSRDACIPNPNRKPHNCSCYSS